MENFTIKPAIVIEGHLHASSRLHSYKPFIESYKNELLYEEEKSKQLDLNRAINILPDDVMKYIYSFIEMCHRNRLRLLEHRYSSNCLINMLKEVRIEYLYKLVGNMALLHSRNGRNRHFWYFRNGLKNRIETVYGWYSTSDMILTIMERLVNYKLSSYDGEHLIDICKNNTKTAMGVTIMDYLRILYTCSRK